MTLAPDGLELGPIGDKIIFENSQVRVWSLELAPGQLQRWHEHHHTYLVIPITAGENVMEFVSGRVVNTHEQPGQALYRQPGEPHQLRNTSTFHYRNVLVELLDQPRAAV